jgi:dipeptidyl aminopeptidase/acylaminoacyl peptidase
MNHFMRMTRTRFAAYTISLLRSFCLAIVVIAVTICYAPLSRAQLDKPLQNIDEDITAFAFAPDGRIVYSVNRAFKTKQYDLEHDDIWIQDPGGKRRRIFIGEKFVRGTNLFTYEVSSFRWSPNGRRILAELFVATLDENGRTTDSMQTLVLEDNGKEVKGGGNEKVIDNAYNPVWLQDNSTVVYLSELVKPRQLFSFHYLNLAGGPPGFVFEGRTFVDSAQIPHSNVAIAVERDRSQTGPPRIQRLDLLSQDDRELATLDEYQGGMSVSPSGKKIAYYTDKEVLEVRDLSDMTRAARMRVGLGVFRWSPDETRILLKRAIEKKSGDLVWIDIPPLTAQASSTKDTDSVAQPSTTSIFHALTFRDFAISPDGHSIGVIAIGKRNLSVFPLPSR